MNEKYVKDKKSGLVIDVSSEYNEYLLKKQRAKKIQNAETELSNLKKEVGDFKKEFSEIKLLLKQLIESK